MEFGRNQKVVLREGGGKWKNSCQKVGERRAGTILKRQRYNREIPVYYRLFICLSPEL